MGTTGCWPIANELVHELGSWSNLDEERGGTRRADG
jgi:hypothetical protein